MSDIRSWSQPYAAIAGQGFSGSPGVDTFVTLASTPEATWPRGGAITGSVSGRLYSISCTNRNAAVRFVQIWMGATPGQTAPFPGAPTMQFEVEPFAVSGPFMVGRDFFGISGLEVVGLSHAAGRSAKLPVGAYNSVAPNKCGFCIAVSTTSGSYVAATQADHDLQGMWGA